MHSVMVFLFYKAMILTLTTACQFDDGSYPLIDCFNLLRLYIYIALTSSSLWHLAALISAASMSPLSLCSLEGHVVIGTDTTVRGNGKSSEVFTTWTYKSWLFN